MYHYEVFVSSARYHGTTTLTYSSEEVLPIGTLVTVPLQRQTVLAVIVSTVSKPDFSTKPIIKQITTNPLPSQHIALIDWLRTYYPAPLGQILSLFFPNSLKQKSRASDKPASSKHRPVTLPKLTIDQNKATKVVLEGNDQSYLLHGETGSGKTRVYLELIKTELDKGRSAILLTPEIGLTSQLAKNVRSTFPDHVVVLHSNMAPATRRKAWLEVLNSEKPLIVLGPRSALFSPLKNIGLIILDEAHDAAYKQEQAPHYVTSRAGAKLAELHQAKLILGTATPLVHDYYAFEQKKLPILRMTESAVERPSALPETEIIDLKERANFSRSPWLSSQLLASIELALANNEQSLVFLNRRGTARLVVCTTCGWQASCPKCDLPLTYHGDKHQMLCHTCGYKTAPPSSCPDCNAADITFKSIGTKALAEELTKLFPNAIVQRFDGDNIRGERLEENYEDILAGKTNIIVGTQLITKGLDLPYLSLVGIVLADTSLYFPDYTAHEQTYQLITQVTGRVNRGHRPGKVVLQTYFPDSNLIKAATTKDYQLFYQDELKERQLFVFPPFAYMLKVSCERASQASAERAMSDIKADLEKTVNGINVSSPSPAFVEKVNGQYRWQLVIKAKQRGKLLEVIEHLPANCTYDIDPSNLL